MERRIKFDLVMQTTVTIVQVMMEGLHHQDDGAILVDVRRSRAAHPQ